VSWQCGRIASTVSIVRRCEKRATWLLRICFYINVKLANDSGERIAMHAEFRGASAHVTGMRDQHLDNVELLEGTNGVLIGGYDAHFPRDLSHGGAARARAARSNPRGMSTPDISGGQFHFDSS
jgi:hypothetical protein